MKIFCCIILCSLIIDLTACFAGNQTPSKTQQEFVDNVLIKAVSDIRATFPVESVKNEFLAIHQDGQNGKLDFYIELTDGRSGVLAFTDRSNDRLIVLNLPEMMRVYKKTNFKTFEDLFVLALTHEHYHLKHHVGTSVSKSQAESEALWYEAETIIAPMIAAGRLGLKDLGGYRGHIDCYYAWLAAKGNKKHPAWRRFIYKYVNHLP